MKKSKISTKRKIYRTVARALMLFSVLFFFAAVFFILVYVFIRGLPHLSLSFLFSSPCYLKGTQGILPDILNTLYIIAAVLIIVLPLGTGGAVYLCEYAKSRRISEIINYAAETLSGIPSVIYGLVGLGIFCNFFRIGTSLLAGALTLSVMNLSTVIKSTAESLKSVAKGLRESAFGLGAGKWRVIRTVVLPECIDGIISGSILTAGKIIGESAALLYTAGLAHAANGFFTALFSPGATLSVALYVFAKERGDYESAFAAAAVLTVLTLILGGFADFISRRFKKRRG